MWENREKDCKTDKKTHKSLLILNESVKVDLQLNKETEPLSLLNIFLLAHLTIIFFP